MAFLPKEKDHRSFVSFSLSLGHMYLRC